LNGLNKDSPPLESLKPLLEAQTSGFWEHWEEGTEKRDEDYSLHILDYVESEVDDRS
jgi:hypothetical protein